MGQQVPGSVGCCTASQCFLGAGCAFGLGPVQSADCSPPPTQPCARLFAGRQDEHGSQEEEEDNGAADGYAAALLHDVRRLAEETLRICKPELLEALRSGGVPLDGLLRLLRLLQRLGALGTGQLLEPGDTVRGRRDSVWADKAMSIQLACAVQYNVVK